MSFSDLGYNTCGEMNNKRLLSADLVSDAGIQVASRENVLNGGEPTTKFFIRSNNEGFQNRQSSVFDVLNDLELKHGNEVAALLLNRQTEVGSTDDDNDQDERDMAEARQPSLAVEFSEERQMQGHDEDGVSKESDFFKIPVGVPPKKRNGETGSSLASLPTTPSIPSYLAHPEKWTKYTLTDVCDGHISENANENAAKKFISGRQQMHCTDDNRKKVTKENCTTAALPDDDGDGRSLMMEWSEPKLTKNLAPKRGKNEKQEPAVMGRLSFLDRAQQEYEYSCEGSCSQRVEAKPDFCSPFATNDDVRELHPPATAPKQLFRTVRKRQRNTRGSTGELTVIDRF